MSPKTPKTPKSKTPKIYIIDFGGKPKPKDVKSIIM